MFLLGVDCADRQETEPFIQASKRTPVDLEAWAISMMERNNRRSHLIPQPTVSETQSGLRGNANGHVATPALGGIPTPLPHPVPIPVALASASSGTSSNAITPTPGTASTAAMSATPGLISTPAMGSASSVGSMPSIGSMGSINSMPLSSIPGNSLPILGSPTVGSISMGSPPGLASANSISSAPSMAPAPVLRTPTTATPGDMVDVHMQALSLDHGSPLNRPYPVRTSSQQAAGQQSPANGSILRAPPSGPLPQIPRSTQF
jgi:hypothetical protein